MFDVKRLKWYVFGVAGILLMCSSFAFAQVSNSEYILKQANYPIFINGVEYEKKLLPILNYKGVTYMPVKFISQELNIEVYWDNKTKTMLINNKQELDLLKLATIAKHYGLNSSDKEYKIEYDLNKDGIIDEKDLQIITNKLYK